jgi:hypothetical protein
MSLQSVPQIVASLGSVSKLIDPALAGGLLSGGLHAVTGPDHVAAVLPNSMGQRWWAGLRVGAIWGLGHGISTMILGLAALMVKNQMSARFKMIEGLSKLAESAVGFSLVFIGLMGIKEVREMGNEGSGHGADARGVTQSRPRSQRAILMNGLLHGFSLDGAQTIAPALAMKGLHSAVFFLVAYCFGTMAAMAITAGALGESSIRLFKNNSNNADLPKKLAFTSSLVALIVGLYWVLKVFI